MMTTLGEMALRIAPHVTSIRNSVMGTVAANSFEDAHLTEENSSWNGGTVWIRGGDSIGQFYVVQQHINNVIYLESDAAIVMEEGDPYTIINADFPLWLLIEVVNSALGKVLVEDETMTFTAGKRMYTLPDGVRRVVHVEFEKTYLDEPYRSPCFHYNVRGDTLQFDHADQARTGDKIILLTETRHAHLEACDDLITSGVSDDYILWTAVVSALEWGYRRYAKDPDRKIEEFLQFAIENKKAATSINVNVPYKKIKTAGW